MTIGVLALQGDVPEHTRALERVLPAGSVTAVRRPADLETIQGLVLPGGESTTLEKLLRETGLFEPVSKRIADGLPVFATCAGLILVSDTLAGRSEAPDPETMGGLAITVRRNDYGQQAESFEAPVRVPELGPVAFPGIFIRAPRILAHAPSVRPIAFHGSEVVGAARGSLWGFTFHPELAADPRLHAAWIGGFAPELLQSPPTRTPAKKRTARTKSAPPKPTARK
ncbi:MAG: pyridoxal 5'-phosphate synthase glutaminase subunit PdxT [Thermoplasmata archaeon]